RGGAAADRRHFRRAVLLSLSASPARHCADLCLELAGAVSRRGVSQLLVPRSLAPGPLALGDACGASLGDEVQPVGGDPARLDGTAHGRLRVLPAARLDRLPPARDRLRDRAGAALPVL